VSSLGVVALVLFDVEPQLAAKPEAGAAMFDDTSCADNIKFSFTNSAVPSWHDPQAGCLACRSMFGSV
jgi:hypothetical protein